MLCPGSRRLEKHVLAGNGGAGFLLALWKAQGEGKAKIITAKTDADVLAIWPDTHAKGKLIDHG